MYYLKGKVYVKDHQEAFGYSDGNEAENYLLQVMEETSDLGIGSEHLARAIRDWPSMYHLSPQRADLLRPFAAFLEGKSVLEIGSGCGAITRYLGETAASVVGVEGSARRAAITAERCRDLPGVTVVQDNFDSFQWEGAFDVVTLIGVLEYSNLFIPGVGSSTRLLERAGAFLRKGGVLLVAIENKLGSKYWAGAPEDHTGKAYYGLENRYTGDTAVTYGKEELRTLLEGAGFPQAQFFFPFPDYKLPTVILREGHLNLPGFNVANLLMPNADYVQEKPYRASFSLPLLLKQLVPNKLVGELANSFLVAATMQGPAPEVVPAGTLGYAYSSQRLRPYAKENRFVREAGGQISVQRRRLHPGLPPLEDPWIRQYVEGEGYLEGDIHFLRFIEIVSTPGWSLAQLAAWAWPYCALLRGLADKEGSLEGRFVDATPFNTMGQGDKLSLFDLEWEVRERLPLRYVLFRGIYYCFVRVNAFQAPAEGTPLQVFALVEALLDMLLPDGAGNALEGFVEREGRYFPGIHYNGHGEPTDWSLPVERDENEQLIARLREENERFRELTLWYRRTYETRSWAGLLLTRLGADWKASLGRGKNNR